MVELLQAAKLECGRAWALSVGRSLVVPNPANTRQSFKWHNHVAPTLRVPGADHGVLVIDPALSPGGPIDLSGWAGMMKARSIEIVTAGLNQEEILRRQAEGALQGRELDAIVFSLRFDEPPIPELGGSGYRIGPGPSEGAGQHARSMMQTYLARQNRARS
jgi:hypothetical protein